MNHIMHDAMFDSTEIDRSMDQFLPLWVHIGFWKGEIDIFTLVVVKSVHAMLVVWTSAVGSRQASDKTAHKVVGI